MNMLVLLSDGTWIDFCIICDNARHSSVYRCWRMFQPYIESNVVKRNIQPAKNTPSRSVFTDCVINTPFYWALFNFLWSFLLNASLHWLYWTALWYLSSYILKYLQCPLNTNHQSPSEDRVIFGCNAWNIVSKSLILTSKIRHALKLNYSIWKRFPYCGEKSRRERKQVEL